MNDWTHLQGTSSVFTLGGKYRTYSKAIDTTHWFWTLDMFRIVENFKALLMHETLRDFFEGDPKNATAYRISFTLEKLKGGFFDNEEEGGSHDQISAHD